MSDYELERMDPTAYANAVDREQQDPLRPYRLKIEAPEAELARLQAVGDKSIPPGHQLSRQELQEGVKWLQEERDAWKKSAEEQLDVVDRAEDEIKRLRTALERTAAIDRALEGGEPR